MDICMRCFPWLNGQSTHNLQFPSDDWEIVSQEEFSVRPGDIVSRGTAKCLNCGQVVSFDWDPTRGYAFAA